MTTKLVTSIAQELGLNDTPPKISGPDAAMLVAQKLVERADNIDNPASKEDYLLAAACIIGTVMTGRGVSSEIEHLHAELALTLVAAGGEVRVTREMVDNAKQESHLVYEVQKHIDQATDTLVYRAKRRELTDPDVAQALNVVKASAMEGNAPAPAAVQ